MAGQVIAQIKEAGVIGAGGAGFPTYAKVDTQVEYVLANCAECEPLIKSDKNLMERYADTIVAGMQIIVEHTKATKGVLAIKAKNKKAVEALENACKKTSAVSVHLLEDFYPAGDEQQIIYEVTGRVIEVGKLPSSVGCVVLNAQTLYQIAQAAQNIPVTERMVTVAGAVEKPFTAMMPIGTPIAHLLQLAGGVTIRDAAVILGGPLMGRIAADVNEEYMTKTTNGVIVLPKDHPLIHKKADDLISQYRVAKSACCQCNYCTMLCPRGLLGLGVKPNKVMQSLMLNDGSILQNGNVALACSNCGLCTYVACNMGLTPHRFVQELRGKLMANKIAFEGELDPANPMRDYSKVSSKRIIARVGISEYDNGTEYVEEPMMPVTVRLQLKQHIGAPAKPIATTGEAVAKGQKIADAAPDALSVPVHASIGGKITKVDVNYIEITGI